MISLSFLSWTTSFQSCSTTLCRAFFSSQRVKIIFFMLWISLYPESLIFPLLSDLDVLLLNFELLLLWYKSKFGVKKMSLLSLEHLESSLNSIAYFFFWLFFALNDFWTCFPRILWISFSSRRSHFFSQY